MKYYYLIGTVTLSETEITQVIYHKKGVGYKMIPSLLIIWHILVNRNVKAKFVELT